MCACSVRTLSRVNQLIHAIVTHLLVSTRAGQTTACFFAGMHVKQGKQLSTNLIHQEIRLASLVPVPLSLLRVILLSLLESSSSSLWLSLFICPSAYPSISLFVCLFALIYCNSVLTYQKQEFTHTHTRTHINERVF